MKPGDLVTAKNRKDGVIPAVYPTTNWGKDVPSGWWWPGEAGILLGFEWEKPEWGTHGMAHVMFRGVPSWTDSACLVPIEETA